MDKTKKDELMRKIQALSFAKVESELYLDTHPDSEMALNYYRDILSKLDEAMTEYHVASVNVDVRGVMFDDKNEERPVPQTDERQEG